MDLEQHFHGIKESHVQAALSLFVPVEIDDGEVLTYEGEVQDALVFVHAGEVVIESGGIELTRLRGPQLFGEVALFTDQPRTATVTARGPVQVLMLMRDSYEALRQTLNPVAWRLEKIAAEALARRVRQAVEDTLRIAPIEPVEVPRKDEVSVGTPLPASAGRLAEKIGVLPEFEDAPSEAITQLAEDLKLSTFPVGSALTVRDKRPADVSILLSGEVDLIVYDQHAKGATIASLGTGAILGDEAMLMTDPSTTNAMVLETVSAVQIKASRFDMLFHGQNPVGSAMRVACIRSMSDKLLQANATMALHTMLERRS